MFRSFLSAYWQSWRRSKLFCISSVHTKPSFSFSSSSSSLHSRPSVCVILSELGMSEGLIRALSVVLDAVNLNARVLILFP